MSYFPGCFEWMEEVCWGVGFVVVWRVDNRKECCICGRGGLGMMGTNRGEGAIGSPWWGGFEFVEEGFCSVGVSWELWR